LAAAAACGVPKDGCGKAVANGEGEAKAGENAEEAEEEVEADGEANAVGTKVGLDAGEAPPNQGLDAEALEAGDAWTEAEAEVEGKAEV
jgi:hypothetical protein